LTTGDAQVVAHGSQAVTGEQTVVAQGEQAVVAQGLHAGVIATGAATATGTTATCARPERCQVPVRKSYQGRIA